MLFVIGANGAGKSALMQHLYAQHRANSRRIAAHRQTWLTSSTVNITPEQRRQTYESLSSQDTRPDARWRDTNPTQRPNIALFDLIDAENVRARQIARQMELEEEEAARKLAHEPSPMGVINRLLQGSNIPIEVAVEKSSELSARRNDGGAYGVAEMSDGERNALLISSEILTADRGALILIDEPERHLHRSISSPLLRQLFAQRSDCCFIVSTHDVSLPVDHPHAETVVLSGCHFNNNRAHAWEADLVPTGAALGEDVRRDVLGGRRQILFVEGTEASLDKPLYDLLFPHMSVVPKQSSRAVIDAVRGVRGSTPLHWVEAVGIIDGDGRGDDERGRLADEGIHALPVFAVESVYYHPQVITQIAARISDLTGDDAEAAVAEARNQALDSIRPEVGRLARLSVHNRVRERLMSRLPTAQEIDGGGVISINLNVEEMINAETARLEKALTEGDLDTIVSGYQVRSTGALTRIAKALGCQSRDQYEKAVLQYIGSDALAAQWVLDLVGLGFLAPPVKGIPNDG